MNDAGLDIGALAARIAATDTAAAAEAQRLLDNKTKPLRSLGRLEDLVCQLAAIRGVGAPLATRPAKAIVVMGADHGVAAEGVSAYPQEVTGQMLLNFARGGAAINVLGAPGGRTRRRRRHGRRASAGSAARDPREPDRTGHRELHARAGDVAGAGAAGAGDGRHPGGCPDRAMASA